MERLSLAPRAVWGNQTSYAGQIGHTRNLKYAAAVLDVLPTPAVLIGADERLFHLNQSAADLLSGAAVGRTYIASMRQPALLDCIEAAFRLGERTETEFVTSVAGRETVWRVSSAPVRLEDGKLSVLMTFEDRTAMHEARQMRRDFVANVSHELRTPLTALIGFIETLKGPARDDADIRARFLDTMEREAGRMNRLIDDLLSLSKVEGVERMRPTDPVDLRSVLESVILALQPFSDETSCEVSLVADDTVMQVAGDQDQLSQVFTNLIENAIKYGGDRVEVKVSRLSQTPGFKGAVAEVSVRDNGEGIDRVHIPRLTERFYRVDSHRSREMGGTGLGLAIVKHIVNRHRGRLKIQSEPGLGTDFSVALPALSDSPFA